MSQHILLPATGDPSDDVVFATALAATLGMPAHFTFLHVRQDPVAAAVGIAGGGMDGGYGAGLLMEAIEQDDVVAEAAARAAFAAFCATSGIAEQAALTVETGEERICLVEHGRTVDLVVIGRPRGREAVALGRLQDVLGGIGRPLLIAAQTCPAALLETVVIAWKDTAQAARAVAVAMPFIARARRVLVMTVGEEASPGSPIDAPSVASRDRLVATLARHNAQVTAWHVPVAGASAVEALLAAATEARASLLVMGGYGHGELREMVFGGFTHSVLGGAAMPVLMMH
ncbi:universal stress protein [Falsiroseomonas selenitidurans]|uniref:Universal stress protein n=1 Tax=Falsiroseomonas selenitidurans TaxID=2716335 RepID=A0ABX1E9I7_9PROT|nr:universal stress protein [Falsiroseomonas selenitidurans]NKC33618.1 universal stress protein [Falsiroseomonas selenitidurans]